MFLQSRIGKILSVLIISLAVWLMAIPTCFAGDTEKAKEHFNNGLTLLKDGNDTLAIIEYDAAIKEDDKFTDAYINLGSIYFNRKKYANAEENFKKATEIDLTNADAWANLGRTYYKMKKYMECEEAYKSSLKAKSDYYGIYKDLGLLYHLQKNWPALVESMEKYTANFADDYLGFYLLGKANRGLRKYPEAIAALKKSTVLKDNYFNSFSTLGQIYQGQEKHKKAYQMFQKAVKIRSNSFRAYYNLAISYETVHQDSPDKMDKIIGYWTKFLKVAKNNPKAKDLIPSTEEHIKALEELKVHYQEEKAKEF